MQNTDTSIVLDEENNDLDLEDVGDGDGDDESDILDSPPRKFTGRWLLLLAGLVVVVSLVATGLWWVSNLKPAADSPEVDFARDMSAHHSQAVDLAVKIHDRTTDPDLRIFTLDIILTQQAQIGQMQGWLSAWQYPLSSSKPLMAGHSPQMMGMATLEQIYALDTLPITEAENSFLQLMIRHHQGGVYMARQVLEKTDQPEVVRLATSIVNSQQSEISYMQSLLKQRGVTS